MRDNDIRHRAPDCGIGQTRLTPSLARERHDAVSLNRKREPAVLERQRLFAEQLPTPAMEGRDVRLIVGCNAVEIVVRKFSPLLPDLTLNVFQFPSMRSQFMIHLTAVEWHLTHSTCRSLAGSGAQFNSLTGIDNR